MTKKTIALISLLGLVLLLTGCAGLFSLPDGGNPGRAQRLIPIDPTAVIELDPAVIGESVIGGDYIPGELVVGYHNPGALTQVMSLVGGSVISTMTMGGLQAALIDLPAGLSVAEAMGRVMLAMREGLGEAAIDGLVFIEPNYIYELIKPVPVDSRIKALQPMVFDPTVDLRPQQWGMDTINAEAGWARATGAGIIVAVLDTGVDGTHPDLLGQVIAGFDPVTGLGIPAGANSDFGAHGTHVAGIIAALNDGVGTVGLAPDVQIMPIPIFQPGSVGSFLIGLGVIWAVDNGADVLNNSWGGAVYSQLVRATFDYALAHGVIPIASAGNDRNAWIAFPAAYSGVIAVGATTPHNERTAFSQFGGWMSVTAPGTRILSTVPGAGFEYWDGTSMSGPFVAALAALLLEIHPTATPCQIRRLMEKTAVDIEAPGFDTASGHGLINVAAAVTAPLPLPGGAVSIFVPTASSMELFGVWEPVPFMDIVLLQDGEIRYWGQTDYFGARDYGFPFGVGAFYGIDPGVYDVIVGGDDTARFNIRTANRVTTTGTVTITSGGTAELILPVSTELQVTLEWTGDTDLDLAIREVDPVAMALVWSTVKTVGIWGDFTPDVVSYGTETYTLRPLRWPDRPYHIAIVAPAATVDSIATITVVQNGVTEVYGPFIIPAGPGGLFGIPPALWWDAMGAPWVF